MFSPKISPKTALVALLVAVAPALLSGQTTPSNNNPPGRKDAKKLLPRLMTSNLPRAEEERQLIATLQSTDRPEQAKVVACHRLAVIGTKAAVPALAALLADEKLAHMARYALEPMTDPAAAAALRDALGRVQGPLLIGVINSLGFRRDAGATPALAGLLASSDEPVATAAAAALGRIGSAGAALQLQNALSTASGSRRSAFVDATLTCAGMLATDRKLRDAAAIYDRLCGTEFPDHIRLAAMGGAIASRQSDGLPLLLKQLESQDTALLAAGWRAARELPGTDVTKALAAEVGKLPVEKQILLIRVLGDRGDQAALPVVLEAANNGAPKVRVAALRALPRIDGGSSSVALLLQAVRAGQSPAESAAALASLGQIGGADTNQKILAALPSAEPAIRAKLIGVLGVRRAENARGDLLKFAASSDVEVGKAAFRALALVAGPTDLPELLRLSTACQNDAVKVPADLAVFAVSMKIDPPEKRAAPILTAYRAATDAPTKCSLLRPLGALVKATGGSPQMFDTVKLALTDADTTVRDAALRCLADWPDASAASLMLETFTRDRDPAHRELALRGGTRMAANVASGRDLTKLDFLAWFTQANQAVRSTEEKLIIVSGLGSVKQIEGWQMLQPYLEDPSVQTEAALAVVAIAPALVTSSHADAVKGVLGKIAKETKDPDIRRQAEVLARSIPPRTPN
jgi:HEAT repeat protein